MQNSVGKLSTLKFDENPDGVQDLRITFSLSEYKFLILLKSGGTPL